jgi:Lrp/AsnC family leucine-responsive transcriptional regulator
MRQGRTTWADLASELGLTAPAIAQRVRRLEKRGLIQGYAALLNPAAVGGVSAFVSLELDDPAARAGIREAMSALDEVQSCDRIAGDVVFLLRVHCLSAAGLDLLTSSTLPSIPGVRVTSVTVVLMTIKDSRVLPLAVLA